LPSEQNSPEQSFSYHLNEAEEGARGVQLHWFEMRAWLAVARHAEMAHPMREMLRIKLWYVRRKSCINK
jgi:hypothetical protein